MKLSSILLGAMLASTMLTAAEGLGPQLESPVLGYVFDDTAKAIRSIAGVPGAASMGENVALGTALAAAYVHSGARLAVGISKAGTLELISWKGRVRSTPLQSGLSHLTQAAFSRTGTRVALTDGVRLEIWSTGDEPVLAAHYEPSGGVTALAVNEAGIAVAGTAEGLILRLSETVQTLATGGDWSALVFSTHGTDVIAADATHGELLRITSEGGRAVIASLPERARAVAVSADDAQFAVALPDSLLLVSGQGESAGVACDCQPKGLDVLTGNLAVHVRGTALVLDADGDEARLTSLPQLNLFNAGGMNQ